MRKVSSSVQERFLSETLCCFCQRCPNIDKWSDLDIRHFAVLRLTVFLRVAAAVSSKSLMPGTLVRQADIQQGQFSCMEIWWWEKLLLLDFCLFCSYARHKDPEMGSSTWQANCFATSRTHMPHDPLKQLPWHNPMNKKYVCNLCSSNNMDLEG